ncbi:MAG: response regulator [Oscillospiraceae bacterium]|nr:response regulator [Oscillospiraceae bacterium]
MEKQMTFILIEDDEVECQKYKDYFYTRDDIKLVAVTNSSDKAIEDVKTYQPDAIIADIELNEGQGSGIDFLEKIKTINLEYEPLISVITHISDRKTHRYAHLNGANFVTYKLRDDYIKQGRELVVQDLFLMHKKLCSITSTYDSKSIKTESIGERKERVSNRINAELNKFCMPSTLKGRAYIHDAILYDALGGEKEHNMTASQYIAKEHKVNNQSNITNNIQTALEHAWDNTAPEELKKLYPVELSYKTFVPTPTQFISHFSDKIKRTL